MSAESEKAILRKQIYGNMNLKETDELLTIWRKGDLEEWTVTALDVVKEIIIDRLGEIPPEEEKTYFSTGQQTLADIDTPIPTQDERIMAALAHSSALVPMMGIIAPIIIWVTQKEKSKYVSFQSLQALAFQLTMFGAYFVGMGCYIASIFATLITKGFSGNSQTNDPMSILGFFIVFFVLGVIFIGGFFFLIYGAIGTVRTFQGKPFRYMIIGKRLDHFLQTKQDVVANQ